MSDDRNPSGEQAGEPWTEAEVAAFVQALMAFQDSLPPRQQAAFTDILAVAGVAFDTSDVQGHVSASIFQMWADHGNFLKSYFSNNVARPTGSDRSPPVAAP